MTKIEWCDETDNQVAGCEKVSPGCLHCFAERMTCRLDGQSLPGYSDGVVKDGRWTGRVVPIPGAVERLAAKCASWRKPRRIFVQSMGDLFHEQVPFELVDRVAAIVADNPRHTFDFLTKRPERMREWASRRGMPGRLQDAHMAAGGGLLWYEETAPAWPLPNLWLGVTAESQEQADARIPVLLDTPAAVRFVSVEPMLGAVDLRKWMPGSYECALSCGYRLPGPPEEIRCIHCGFQGPDTIEVWGDGDIEDCPECHDCSETEPVCPECGTYMVTDHPDTPHLDWVICGGETGPGARCMKPEWAKALQDQCASAGVPFFFKKMGSWWGKGAGEVNDPVREFPQVGR